MTAERKFDGKLEIKLADGQIKEIYATKIVSNKIEYWKYEQRNGRTLIKKSLLNPKLWAEKLAKEYLSRDFEGEIHWQYCQKNHTQHEKMVLEKYSESV
ncbi:MAG: hypothetical protein JRI26_09205 [Deltaproteobacteria bacterium]|nr:hypothetical protein [Deltaproteobacteria bacterium]